MASLQIKPQKHFNYEINFSDIDRSSLNHLFAIAKRDVSTIRNSLKSVSGGGSDPRSSVELEIIKNGVIDFIESIVTCFRSDEIEDEDILTMIVDNVKLLLLFTSRVCELDEFSLQEALKDEESTEFLFLEMILDIWMSGVELFILAKKNGISPSEPQMIGDQDSSSSFTIQIIQLLISDLMKVSLDRFNKFPKNGDIETLRPFQSSVFTKRLIKLKNLLDSNTIPFWSTVTTVADVILKPINSEPVPFLRYCSLDIFRVSRNSNSKVAVLWIMISYKNVTKCKVETQSDLLYLSNLVTSIIGHENPDSLSSSLFMTLKLVKLCYKNWLTKCDLILPFFGLMVRRIKRLDGLNTQSLPTNCKEWSNEAIKILESESSETISRPDLFSMILQTWIFVINKINSSSDPESREQLDKLKEELFSKLCLKKFNDFTDIGLFKLLTIFVTFAFWNPNYWNDVSNALIEIGKRYFQLELSNKKMFISGMFTLLCVMPSNSSWEQIVTFTTSTFKESCLSLWQADIVIDSFKYKSILKTINGYLNEKTIFESTKSNDELSQKLTQELDELLFEIMEKSMYSEKETLDKVEPFLKVLAEDIRRDEKRPIECIIFPAMRRFIDRYLGSAPNARVFKSLEIMIKHFPELIHGSETIFGVLNFAIGAIETRRRVGTDSDLRKFLNQLVKKLSK